MSSENYLENAISDARETAENFIDEIVESYMDNDGEASNDLNNDYSNGDSYHHESHVDKWYGLSDAAAVLEQLDDYEETDSGLWEGQAPRDAISTQAAFTYGQAVMCLWQDLIKEINEDDDLTTLFEEYNNLEDTIQEEIDALDEGEKAFDQDDELDRRQAEMKPQIKKKIEDIVEAFDG